MGLRGELPVVVTSSSDSSAVEGGSHAAPPFSAAASRRDPARRAYGDGERCIERRAQAADGRELPRLVEPLRGVAVKAEGHHVLDGERVLVLFHFRARRKASGLEIGRIWTKSATLFHVATAR